MKILWTGTDSLMLIDLSKRKLTKRPYWLLFRVFARIADLFTQEHYTDNELIAENLRKFGVKKRITVHPDKLLHTEKYPKIKHLEFNVLYYFPKQGMELKFRKWLYGWDIIQQVKADNPDVNFIEVNGDQDMKEIYPITDLYLRPNRHDGASRMVQECEIQEIPYYHSLKYPFIDIIQSYIDIEKIKKYGYEAITKTKHLQGKKNA